MTRTSCTHRSNGLPLAAAGAAPRSPQRRGFLKLALGGAAAASLFSPWDLVRRARATTAPGSPSADPASPITSLTDSVKQAGFNGDQFERAHRILWDKAGYLAEHGGIPAAGERVRVAVLGGGMAGLASAYQLRDLKPVVLEGAPNFGGNSRGESWGGSEYSIGAAYITIPDEGSSVELMLKDLGLWERGRQDDPNDAVALIDDRMSSPFWEGVTDPANASEFKRVFEAFAHVRDHAFPEVPWIPESQLTKERTDELDAMSFSAWIEKTLGKIHPHVQEFIHEYCWSSFAADPSELSAAQGLNFLACDLGGDIVFPGGNAAITRAFHERLKQLNGADTLRPGCLVIDVAVTAEGVRICYETPQRELKTLLADACVMAAPKFVARNAIDEATLPAAQAEAMKRISYRTYVVGNVLIRGRVKSEGYDLFRLSGNGPGDPRDQTNVRPYTDLIFANWASEKDGSGRDNTVLSLYKAFPYDGARQFAFNPSFYVKHKGLIEASLPGTLSMLGIGPDRVHDVRMTRWGHALPVAGVGLLSSGVLARASAPIAGRIFFANQDNYANPAFEASFGSAEIAARELRAALASRG